MAACVSVAELAEGAAHEPLLDAEGRVRHPLLVVDLDTPLPSHVLARAALAAQSCDRVLVGLAAERVPGQSRALTEALDLSLVPAAADTRRELVASSHPADDANTLQAAATANPQATLVLAHILRATGQLDVPAALDAESFAYSTLLGGAEFATWLARRRARPLPPQVHDPVLLSRDGALLRITLNRPQRRNAYGRELRDALVAALQLAELDSTIDKVVLDGMGPSFCSGGDLDEFGTTPDLATAHLVRTRAGAALPMHRLADRLEVHVHGSCVGAGIELPAFAGRVVAHPDTTFRLPEVSMGLIPGAGGTVSLPRRIGRWRTLHMALSGRPLDAVTARSWGLIDAVES
ncbi:enoyl-CoA hydratase/isomerase family protein [Saccharomonospora sp. NPDC046836]|uniref:enoyl-CoA hydratase/isomerase family protein n=1 Tax=Saccharomonospora sp. NPDC046836 TaxID=3156921 RepID=UPI0034112060